MDIDKFGDILTCVYVDHVLFRNGHPSYDNNFIDFIFDMKISKIVNSMRNETK